MRVPPEAWGVQRWREEGSAESYGVTGVGGIEMPPHRVESCFPAVSSLRSPGPPPPPEPPGPCTAWAAETRDAGLQNWPHRTLANQRLLVPSEVSDFPT